MGKEPSVYLRRSPLGWAIVLLLGVIAACLLFQAFAGSDVAIAQSPTRGENGMVAVAGQISSDVFGLYLVDTQSKTVCVYQYVGGNTRKLKLLAARTYTYDSQLDEYNTEPSPREIKTLVEQHRRLENTTTKPE